MACAGDVGVVPKVAIQAFSSAASLEVSGFSEAARSIELAGSTGVIQSDVEYSRPIQPSQELQNDRAIAE